MSDRFYMEKNGKITSRHTYTEKSIYIDDDGDGVYDKKQIDVAGGGVWYTRDKNGNWQMEM